MNHSKHSQPLFARHTTKRTLFAVAAFAALVTVMPSEAGPPATSQDTATAQKDAMMAARQLHAEYVEIQNDLNRIQQETMEANPELREQEQAFVDLLMTKMPSGGTRAKEELAAIEKLEQKFGSEETSDNDRQTLMVEYKEKVMAFREDQMQALKDPSVQKAQDALINAKIAAMKQQDPQTEQLMQQLQQKQKQMNQIMKASGQAQ